MKTYDVEIVVRVAVNAACEEDAIAEAVQFASEEDLSFIASFNVVETEGADA